MATMQHFCQIQPGTLIQWHNRRDVCKCVFEVQSTVGKQKWYVGLESICVIADPKCSVKRTRGRGSRSGKHGHLKGMPYYFPPDMEVVTFSLATALKRLDPDDVS